MRQVFPVTAACQHIKYGVENFSHVGFAFVSDVVCWNHPFNDFPLGVGQVGRVRFSCFRLIFHDFASVKGSGEQIFDGGNITQIAKVPNVNILAQLPRPL